MSKSDISINVKIFDPEIAHVSTKALNTYLVEHGDKGPKWWEVSHPGAGLRCYVGITSACAFISQANLN
jgi:hypothetical protein